ncbi:MAG: IS66 family transposase [Bacillota bacterium]
MDHPQVPMDNNLAERMLRPVALGRKNSNGTFSEWGGQFMAMCMSILRTVAEHGLDPCAYLRHYLDACAANGGPPADLERFLPWNVLKENLEKHALRRRDGL